MAHPLALIPELVRQRQADLCELEASLVYSKFQENWGCYTKKPYLLKTKQKFRKNKIYH